MAVAVSQSCSEEADCTDATRPMMNANFYTVLKDTLPDGYVRDSVVGIAWDSLTVTAFGTDSVIINRETSVHAVSLPLRYAEETTVIVLHYTDAYKDPASQEHALLPEHGLWLPDETRAPRHQLHDASAGLYRYKRP